MFCIYYFLGFYFLKKKKVYCSVFWCIGNIECNSLYEIVTLILPKSLNIFKGQNNLISHIPPQKIRMEAHAKFAVLWHLTRDLHINKSSSFARSFDRLVTFYIQIL